MNQPEPIDSGFFNVDEKRIHVFEQSWLDGSPQEIESSLPVETDASYLGTLEELAHIEMEFQWKESDEDSTTPAPTAQDYLVRFPALEPVSLALILSEFELAHRFGRDMSIDQFVDRYGPNRDGKPIRSLLDQQLISMRQSKKVKPGATLGRYQIMNEHGRGGFGAVWRAKDTKLGRRIAVKQLGQRLARDAQSRRRFISEARVTARLEHPGIVPVYDISNVNDDHAYYTMRLIQGQTMAEAIDDLHSPSRELPGTDINQTDGSSIDNFQLNRRQLLQSFVDACQTIEYAHAQGVIHRDLKPQNIIVGDYGETILLDWGLASVLDDAVPGNESEPMQEDPGILSKEESVQTLAGGIEGTPAYMSPEQARGDLDKVSKFSDVYSLGATLYHMVTGKVPFTDGPIENLLERVRSGDLPSASEVNASVEPALSAIVSKAMQNKATERYNRVASLLDDVQRFLADQPVVAYRDTFLERSARWIRKHPAKTVGVGLTVFFSAIALSIGLMAQNAWKLKEEKRIGQLQVTAERTNDSALLEVRSGQFRSAVESLDQALGLISDESDLQDLASKLLERKKRTQQIVDFYDLGLRGQEETFFDRTDRAAIYCQAALNQFHIFDNVDWWNQLPDQDLTLTQKQQLQSEVYRITTLLASMRMAEIATDTVSLDLIIKAEKVATDDPLLNSLRSARFAANVANRFRPARSMRMIEDVSRVAEGISESIDLTDINPLNAVDSAVMGSILDNNVAYEGPSRTAVSALLQMRDPNVVAKQWLDDALKHNPDWYWLPVFLGRSQVRTGDPYGGIRTISHAVGIRPDYWVGYQYRAIASVEASVQEKSRRRKMELLNSARRDIQRALDLEPNNSELYWTRAIIQIASEADPTQITQTFLTAFRLHPRLDQIKGGHYSGVSKYFYSRAEEYVKWQKGLGQLTPDLTRLEIIIALWKQELDEANILCEAAIESLSQSEDSVVDKEREKSRLISLSQLIAHSKFTNDLNGETNKEETEDATTPQIYDELISFETNSTFAWNFLIANAEKRHQGGELSSEKSLLELALKKSTCDWQTIHTNSRMIVCLIGLKLEDQATALLNETIRKDPAIDLNEITAISKQYKLPSLIEICETHREFTEHRVDFLEIANREIAAPALLNGGFELGLSFDWAPFAERKTASSWNNLAQSKSIAEAVREGANESVPEGQRCLRIKLNCPLDNESLGTMRQAIPVTPGTMYELTFWSRSENLNGNVSIGIAGPKGKTLKHFAKLASETDGLNTWQQSKLTFDSESDIAIVTIQAQGTGTVWIDDLQIHSIE